MPERDLNHKKSGQMLDHPIFVESIRQIQNQLGPTGLDSFQQQVLVRLIHSSGDIDLLSLLSFSPGACKLGISALKSGGIILTDTAMAAAAVLPMARRTLNNRVGCVLDWAPNKSPQGSTRTAAGMIKAWPELADQSQINQLPIVLIGSSPTALEALLDLVEQGALAPSLIIGMPVGFVGVLQSKYRLANSGLPHILLNGTRGGAGLAAAAINALLRAAVLSDLEEN